MAIDIRLPAHYYELRPHESESDAAVAAAIERLAADPRYWKALRQAERRTRVHRARAEKGKKS